MAAKTDAAFRCLLVDAGQPCPLALVAAFRVSMEGLEPEKRRIRFLLAGGGVNHDGTGNESLEISRLDGLSRERFSDTKCAASSFENAFTGDPSTPAIPSATKLR